MKKGQPAFVFAAFLLLSAFSCAGLPGTGGAEPEPTAVIVDAETGEPVEGAVALAVWWGSMSAGGLGGGGSGIPVARRVVETVSDARGRVWIDNFWDWHVFASDNPHLSVYKCGYVCWNRYYKCGVGLWEGFDKENRVVRLEKRPEEFSFNDHRKFISSIVTHHGIFGSDRIFNNTFLECERKFSLEERMKNGK